MPSAVRKDSSKPYHAGLAFDEVSSPASARRAAADAREILLCASHDLRSPFAAIKLSAEGIERRWRKGEPIAETEWANAMIRIGKAADGALRLMEDLLSVERLGLRDEPGMSKKTPSALVDVTEVIGEAISLQREHLDRARCEVMVRCAEGLTARGRWDRGSLLRIFSNLLQNVSRYAPARPSASRCFGGQIVSGSGSPTTVPGSLGPAFSRQPCPDRRALEDTDWVCG